MPQADWTPPSNRTRAGCRYCSPDRAKTSPQVVSVCANTTETNSASGSPAGISDRGTAAGSAPWSTGSVFRMSEGSTPRNIATSAIAMIPSPPIPPTRAPRPSPTGLMPRRSSMLRLRRPICQRMAIFPSSVAFPTAEHSVGAAGSEPLAGARRSPRRCGISRRAAARAAGARRRRRRRRSPAAAPAGCRSSPPPAPRSAPGR